jgi:twitching motility protein PilT
MVPNAAIRNLIREDKIQQIYSIMQTGQSKYGMLTLNQSLYELYVKKLISYEDCVGRSSNVDELVQMLGRSGLASGQTVQKEYR